MSCRTDTKIIKQHDKRGKITQNKSVQSLMTQDGETGYWYYMVEKLLPNDYQWESQEWQAEQPGMEMYVEISMFVWKSKNKQLNTKCIIKAGGLARCQQLHILV